MKVNDLVVITDGSYIQEITPDGLSSVSLNYGALRGLKYRVVATQCRFPKEDTYQSEKHINDTIICGREGCVEGRFFVCSHTLIRLTKHTIVIDGKTVELSHESYLNLKEQLI